MASLACIAQDDPMAFPLPVGCNMQLFPDGEFAARDGRPASLENVVTTTWKINEAIAAKLIEQVAAQSTSLLVDYEHQTLAAAKNGKPAPASGWVTNLVYKKGQGIFAQVAWTKTAQAYIDAGEYRYVSPVFTFDRETGEITRILHIALTNSPALDGMLAVAAREEILKTMEKNTMKDSSKDFFVRLCTELSLPETANEEEIIVAIKDLVKSKAKEQPVAASYKQPSSTNLNSVSQEQGEPMVPLSVLTALQHEMADKSALFVQKARESDEQALTNSIQSALADGRLTKSLEDWAYKLGRTDRATLDSYLYSAKPIAALTTMQTTSMQTQQTATNSSLSEEDKYAARQLGISDTDFVTYKKVK